MLLEQIVPLGNSLKNKLSTELQQQYGTILQNKIDQDPNIHSSVKHVIDRLLSYDPSSTKQYIHWIISQYLNGHSKLEELYNVYYDLVTFSRIKDQLPESDINKYTADTLSKVVQ